MLARPPVDTLSEVIVLALDKSEIVNLYRKRAENYDFSANLYYLIGVRENLYRTMAVNALDLKPGDTVLEIACGTGLNFSRLQKAVGATGKIIGIDMTDKMLDQARKRIAVTGWTNVELIKTDAAKYDFPRGFNGILSTFAITLIPEYDQIIKRGSDALDPGGRFAILDFKEPAGKPRWLTAVLVALTRPFGVSLDLADRHPWGSIERYLAKQCFKELFFGFCYLSVGEAVPPD